MKDALLRHFPLIISVPLALKEYDEGYSYIAGFGRREKQISSIDMKGR